MNKIVSNYKLGRKEALKNIVSKLKSHDICVGTTGFLSRELYEIREEIN